MLNEDSNYNQIIQNVFEWESQIRGKTHVGQRSASSEESARTVG